MKRIATLVALVSLSTFVQSCGNDQVDCGNGLVCPAGQSCYFPGDGDTLCVYAEELEACDGLEDSAPCEVFDADGVCVRGVCTL